MSTGLLAQLQTYYSQIDEIQDPIRPDEVAQLSNNIRELPTAGEPMRMPRRRMWAAALAAVVVVLFVGGVAWLSRQGPAEVVEEPTTTTTIQASTTTTVAETNRVDLEGFAPAVSGVDLADEGWVTFGSGSEEFVFGDSKFIVTESSWGIDWRAMIRSVMDEATRDRVAQVTGSRSEIVRDWNAAQGILDFHLWQSDESIGRLGLVFSGSSDDWVIDMTDIATGNSFGSIAGSLPGFHEDEIMERVASGRQAAWFFVPDGEAHVAVAPPWAAAFEEGGTRFVVLEDRLFAFVVTDGAGPGQMTIFASADGMVWQDLGETPWAGTIYAVDMLFELDGRILAVVSNSGERPSSEEEGTLHFWVSGDGTDWFEMTEEEWVSLPGSIDPRPDPEADPSVVEYFDEVMAGSTVIPDESVVIQPAQGPAPQFDTSTLGSQIALDSTAPDGSIVERLTEFYGDPDEDPPSLGLILYIGRIEQPFGLDLFIWTDEWRSSWNYAVEGAAGGSGGSGLGDLGAEADPVKVKDSEYFVVFVPAEAAAVVLTMEDAQPLWQRPIGGWTFFPLALEGYTPYTLEVYDASGTVIATDSG